MKGRQSAEKRRKELLRLERQRDKADRRKLRKEQPIGEGDEDGVIDPITGVAPPDVPLGESIPSGAEARPDEKAF
jgi:hypothetical protein